MRAQQVLPLVVGAALVAAAAFYLGSYVFPHSKGTAALSEPAEVPSDSATGSLGSFGISLPDPATPSVGATATAGAATLDAATLEALKNPVKGRLVGQFVKRGDEGNTIVVKVIDFTVLVPDEGGRMTRRTLPRGVPVTIVLPDTSAGAAAVTLPGPGGTIQADIRIEPARGDLPDRIVAVNLVVPGARP